MSPLHACTIVSNNYLAYARVLTRSFLAEHPDGTMHVLVVDRPQSGHSYEAEPFTVTFVEELAIPGFLPLAFSSTLLELNTAVKPHFLTWLHRTLGCPSVLYFDPDILVTAPLTALYAKLETADALLTPHLTAPLEDEKIPSERDILVSGIYNLGFLGLAYNERTLSFLDWWGRRLLLDCRNSVQEGLFVDQRWMDFAPAFLPRAEILMDPGCNAAYWNLAHRRLSPVASDWRVGEAALTFFHFSGIDPERPELISRYQNRFSFVERPDLRPLFELYQRRLLEEGQATVRRYVYAFGRFSNGLAIPDEARRAYRLLDPGHTRWPDPFAAGDAASFLSFLAAPLKESVLPLPRLAALLWDERKDLQWRFPAPLGRDQEDFARWYLPHGERADGTEDTFSGPLRRALAARDRASTADSAEHRAIEALHQGMETPSFRDPEILRWLLAEAGYEPGCRPLLPRLAIELHRRRNDLMASFPDPLGRDRRNLALWLTTSGWIEYQLPRKLVEPVLRSLSARDRIWAILWRRKHRRKEDGRQGPPVGAQCAEARIGTVEAGAARLRQTLSPEGADCTSPLGVDLLGFIRAATGVGEACRATTAALREGCIPHDVWDLAPNHHAEPERGCELATAPRERAPLHPISLFHVNADGMMPAWRLLPRGTSLTRRRVAVWFWELAHFPLAFAEAFAGLDEVWAPSRFCERAFLPLSPIPIRWVPPCVLPPTADPARRADLAVPAGAFLFYFAFDTASVPERKNPAGLLEAFAEAVRQSPRPLHLLLKVQRGEAQPAVMAELRERAASLPVTWIEKTLNRADQDGLLAACDAYVSLHRSEGLGLPLIEAMYAGKPVIATGYGGVTDFLDEGTASVVPYRLIPLARQTGPYPAGAVWADPDLQEAATRMVALSSDPRSLLPRTQAAAERVRSLYSPQVAARRLRAELTRLLG